MPKAIKSDSICSQRLFISTLIAKVLRVDDSRKLPLATKIINAMFPLHIGAYGGVRMRILYIFIGIAPAVLPYWFCHLVEQNLWGKKFKARNVINVFV